MIVVPNGYLRYRTVTARWLANRIEGMPDVARLLSETGPISHGGVPDVGELSDA